MSSIGVRRYIAAFVNCVAWLLVAADSCLGADCSTGLTAQQRLAHFKAADQQAETSMREHQFPLAVTLYKEAVCLLPDSPRGWYGLGMAEAAAGSFRDARESLKKADKLRPITPMPLIMQVRANVSLHDENALKENLRDIAQRFPTDRQAHETLERFLAEQNMLDLALAEALRANRAAPPEPTARLQLAGLENSAGAYSDAARTAQQVSELPSASAEIRAAAAGITGLSYESLGKKEEAIKYLRQAVELDPNQENSYLALCDLYDQLQRYREAADLLTQARQRLPQSTAILLPLGTDLIRAERYATGIAVLREVIQREPQKSDAYVRLAEAAHRMGDSPEEIQMLQEVKRQRPDYPMIDVLIGRAMLAQEKRDYPAVLRQLAVAEKHAPSDPEIYLMRGRVYIALEQYQAAVAPLRRAIELRPLDTATYYQLARVYQKLGKSEDARAQFERVKHLESTAHP